MKECDICGMYQSSDDPSECWCKILAAKAARIAELEAALRASYEALCTGNSDTETRAVAMIDALKIRKV